MGWLDSNWRYRVPLTIANHSGVAAPEAIITIPSALEKFWDNVQSDFDDVRVTAADGVTLLTFNTSGTANAASRQLTLHIDDTNHNVSNLYGNAAASASIGAWLYFGNDDSSLSAGTNANTNVTVNSAKAALVELADPFSSSTCFNLTVQPLSVRQDHPVGEIRKSSATSTKVFWDLSAATLKLKRSNQNSLHSEEIAYVKAVIYDQDGADTTSAMTVLNEITIMDNHVVQMPIKAGDHEKRYMLILTFGLVDESGGLRVLDQRATLHVQNTQIHPSIVTT